MRPKQAHVASRVTRRCYLAEVQLKVTASELSWISKSLMAACLRLQGSDRLPQVRSAVYVSDEDRLACIVEATCVEDVHRLLGIALLPPARVVEATFVAPQRREKYVAR